MTSDRRDLGTAIQGSLLDAIGETPMVELSQVCDPSHGRIIAKLESFNPTGSKQDRVARQVVADARAEGRLSQCQTIVAAVDGVMGVALAQACAIKRHPFIAVMLRGTGEAQAAAMEVLGCEIEWVEPEAHTLPGVVTRSDHARMDEAVLGIVAITGAYDPRLRENPSSYRAHQHGTGAEMARQAGGHFGAFVDFVGTGGTLAGCTAAFQEFDTSIRCYAAEPERCAALGGAVELVDDHGILGGGAGMANLPLLSPEVLSGTVAVTLDEARRAMEDLARKEGLVTGLSTGANLVAARKLLEGPCFGDVVAILVHDRGGHVASARLRETALAPRRRAA